MSRYLAFIIILLPLALQAQITAPGSRTVRLTNYPATARQDPVFIFCVPDASATGTLVAASPGGTAPYTFVWTRYDQTGGGYSIAVKTESGVTSTASGLAEGDTGSESPTEEDTAPTSMLGSTLTNRCQVRRCFTIHATTWHLTARQPLTTSSIMTPPPMPRGSCPTE
ncbi:MAG: hypothetical protein MZV63_53930 [Marinilabiliales bacterium]|nr:hypothetical protein [Marinilabiliales bacterium]